MTLWFRLGIAELKNIAVHSLTLCSHKSRHKGAGKTLLCVVFKEPALNLHQQELMNAVINYNQRITEYYLM